MIVRSPSGHVVVVEVVEFLRGEWCNDCMLPSALRVTTATTPAGLPTALNTVVRCIDCGN